MLAKGPWLWTERDEPWNIKAGHADIEQLYIASI
jgi:hypothetical protein